jgi:hypothetical protein
MTTEYPTFIQEMEHLQSEVYHAYRDSKRNISATDFFGLYERIYRIDPFPLTALREQEYTERMAEHSQEADDIFILVSREHSSDQEYDAALDRMNPELTRLDLTESESRVLIDEAIDAIGSLIVRYRERMETDPRLLSAFPPGDALSNAVADMIKYPLWKGFADYLYSMGWWPFERE